MVTWCWQIGCFRTTERKHSDILTRNRDEGSLNADCRFCILPHIIASPNGTKVLFVERDGGNGALTRIFVLDMSGSRFVTIDRDPSAVGNEHRADWFDNDTVLVDNNTCDDSGNSTGESWIYLYDFE